MMTGSLAQEAAIPLLADAAVWHAKVGSTPIHYLAPPLGRLIIYLPTVQDGRVYAHRLTAKSGY